MIYLLNYKSNPQNKTPLTKPIDLQSTQNPIFQTRPPWWTWRANQHRSQAQPLQLGLFYIIFASATSNSPQRKANLQPPLELHCFFPKSFFFFFFFFFFVSRIQFICINFFFWCVLSLGDLKILQFWGKKKSLIRQWWIFLVYFEFSIFCSVWLSRKWCKIEVKISMFLVVVEIFFDYFCGFGFLENEREEKDIFVLGTLYQMQILVCIYFFFK